jgi:hypothetical protein
VAWRDISVGAIITAVLFEGAPCVDCAAALAASWRLRPH